MADRRGALLALTILALLVLLALAVRSLGYYEVFPSQGSAVLSIADGSYHARRAFFSFARFPAALFFDPLLNHPDGAPVPMPPLYDWALGGVARLLTASTPGFERVAAWSSPVLAALCVIPVAAAGRVVRGAGTGLGAAAIFALLPVHVNFSRLGEPDHHAAVALLGASTLALTLAAAALPAHARRRGLAVQAGLALLRAAMLLTWSGSLLYVAIAEGTLLGVAVLGARGDLLRGQALGALAAALAVVPVVAAGGTPLGGPFTSTTLSWLHPIALTGVGGVAGALALWERRRPAASAAGRALRAALLIAFALGALLAWPTLRAALLPAADFLQRDDGWGAGSLEQRPLFSRRAALHAPRDAVQLYGGFAYGIPFAAIAALWRARRLRDAGDPGRALAALALAGWAAPLGALALLQVRFGADFAPAGSVGFALGLAELRDGLAPRLRGAASAVALALGALLLAPAVMREHVPALRRARALAAAGPEARAALPPGSAESLQRFAHLVREATPETAGFLDPEARPEYGVLCPPNLGHVLHYSARRATPAGNFGPYLDRAKLAQVVDFYAARSEPEALAIARRLGTRYAVTAAPARQRGARFADGLQRADGAAHAGAPHSGHFRLVTEGPPGGRPLRIVAPDWRAGDGAPYKLFEIVEGAELETAAVPGSELVAELDLETPAGRRFVWLGRATAGADGFARLRVPYAVPSATPVRALGPYRLRLDGLAFEAAPSEQDVQRGARVALSAAR